MVAESGGPLPAQQTFRVLEHVWIPMVDSVRLSARLWLPDADQPAPVVLEYIPYRKRDSYRPHDNAWGKVLASRGIAFARVDVRGSGDSEGVLTDEYTELELDDGVSCIDWLARQDWCNGNVGMRGISWGAINTLMIAARQPAALKAIVPIAGTDKRFTDDAHYHGGLLGRANLQWGVLFKLVMAGPPDPDVVGERWRAMWKQRLDATPAIVTQWLQTQHDDEYWQRGSVMMDYAAIRCPTYVVAGWLDTYSNPVGRLLERLQAPRKGLIGPWGHTYPELANPGGVDWAREEIRWWRHWLVGEETGIMAEPSFRAFVPEATARQSHPERQPGRWVSGQWPAETSSVARFWLGAAGLEEKPEPAEEVVVSSPGPVGACKPEWLNKLPVEQTPDDRLSRCFDSAPLEQALDLLGYPVVYLHVASDQPVASISLRLNDVTPAGESWLVSCGVANLSHSVANPPRPLTPGRRYEIRVPMAMIAHRFRRGHRLRLAVSAGLWPMTWPAPVAARLTLTTGVSFLELPLWTGRDDALEFELPEAGERGAQPPALPATTRREADGSYVYNDETTDWDYVDADTGTRLTGSVGGSSRLSPDGECFWRQEASRGWQRDGWHCEVEASCELTASADDFRVRETLRAFEGGTLVFQRHTDDKVPRRLL